MQPWRRRFVATALACLTLATGCTSSQSPAENAAGQHETDPAETAEAASAAVPIESTGADTERDLIRSDDPSALTCLVSLGVAPGEFYDKVSDELLFPDTTYFFEAQYADGSTVEIRIHPDLVNEGDSDVAARDQAERIAEPIGRLPTELRRGIERVGFLGGDATAQGDGGGEGIHERDQAGRNQSV